MKPFLSSSHTAILQCRESLDQFPDSPGSSPARVAPGYTHSAQSEPVVLNHLESARTRCDAANSHSPPLADPSVASPPGRIPTHPLRAASTSTRKHCPTGQAQMEYSSSAFATRGMHPLPKRPAVAIACCHS